MFVTRASKDAAKVHGVGFYLVQYPFSTTGYLLRVERGAVSGAAQRIDKA